MINAWQQLINYAGKFKDQHDPKNKYILTQSLDLPRDKKQADESITGTLTKMSKNGLVKKRHDINSPLQNA
ncbi:hypothetical protein, partial [Pseudoalteromonas sp. 120-MNA-CIBAN-0494]|uniref:hypothetical protein n=1 Tax=Pseudoalteromonas sp. 120-MNA-CIBAN-0494 TaxID=3140427 RepID=UPI00332605A1